eukprot:TRINITY_DN22635_c0_g1_i2.p1 TRINITY_DN22635_c0_g1~~TRINITY_DN22635_c0_g1_i2.p1  ORF type:complete len:1320 (+),score=256.20 TRINITY_DN22635_c0_g1_i2:390-3962(+)
MVSPGYTNAEWNEAVHLYEEGTHWYCTRDRMEKRADGSGLVFAGRVDDLIKVGGVWVDTREVEQKLMDVAVVKEAKLLDRNAFVVLHTLREGTLASLRRLLPSGFSLVLVPSLPRRTGTDKVDRRRLAELSGHSCEGEAGVAAAGDAPGGAMAEAAWREQELKELVPWYSPLLLVFASALFWEVVTLALASNAGALLLWAPLRLLWSLAWRFLCLSYIILASLHWHRMEQVLHYLPFGVPGVAVFASAAAPGPLAGLVLAAPGAWRAWQRGRLASWPAVCFAGFPLWARQAGRWWARQGVGDILKWYASLARSYAARLGDVAVIRFCKDPRRGVRRLLGRERECKECKKHFDVSQGCVDLAVDSFWYCHTCWRFYHSHRCCSSCGKWRCRGREDAEHGWRCLTCASKPTAAAPAPTASEPSDAGSGGTGGPGDSAAVVADETIATAGAACASNADASVPVAADDGATAGGAEVSAEEANAEIAATVEDAEAETGRTAAVAAAATDASPTTLTRPATDAPVGVADETAAKAQPEKGTQWQNGPKRVYRYAIEIAYDAPCVHFQPRTVSSDEVRQLEEEPGDAPENGHELAEAGAEEVEDSVAARRPPAWRIIERAAGWTFPNENASVSGLDSLRTTKIVSALRREAGVQLPHETLRRCSTLKELLAEIAELPAEALVDGSNGSGGGRDGKKLDGKSKGLGEYAAWNIMWNAKCSWTVRRAKPVREAEMRMALSQLIERHEALRAELVDPPRIFDSTQQAFTLFEMLCASLCPRRRHQQRPAINTNDAESDGASSLVRQMAGVLRRCTAEALRWVERATRASFRDAWPKARGRQLKQGGQAEPLPLTVLPRANTEEEALHALWYGAPRFVPPLVVALVPFGPEGAEEGALVHISVTHMFSDGYSLVPLLTDLAQLVARAEGCSPVPPPLPAVPSALAALERRLQRTIRGDGAGDAVTLEVIGRRRGGNREGTTVHATLPEKLVMALQGAARRLAVPDEVVMLAALGATLARLENRGIALLSMVVPQRDGPGESDMVGLFADLRVLALQTEGLSLAGLALQVHHSVKERLWCAPPLGVLYDVPMVNFEWTDFESRQGFTQLVQTRSGAEMILNPLKVAVDQPSRGTWRMRNSFDCAVYDHARRERFFELFHECVRFMIEDPLVMVWPDGKVSGREDDRKAAEGDAQGSLTAAP